MHYWSKIYEIISSESLIQFLLIIKVSTICFLSKCCNSIFFKFYVHLKWKKKHALANEFLFVFTMLINSCETIKR